MLGLAAFATTAHFWGKMKFGFFDDTGFAGCIYTASQQTYTQNSTTVFSPVYKRTPEISLHRLLSIQISNLPTFLVGPKAVQKRDSK